MISINTQYFKESALYFNKHGRYDDGIFDSYHYHEFWERERERCLNGYEISGMKITGDHYWYLNYWPIMLTRAVDPEKLYGEVFKDKRIQGQRKRDFPDFWDVDYAFYNEIQLARANGQHFIWLKPRGVGASFKGSAMAGRLFFLRPGSKTFMVAWTTEALLGDGLFTKWLNGRSFMNAPHPDEDRYMTAFGKPSEYKKDQNDMWFRASSNVNGEERGYMSETMGISVKDDIDKVRGKRGDLALLEEFGANPQGDKVFNIMRSSFEEQDMTYGMILGLGTGGSEATKFGAMEKMVYSPEAYNVRCFDNIYDDGMKGTKIAFFTPSYRSIRFKDKNGNSDEKKGLAWYNKQREDAAKSSDGNALIQEKAEHPFCPQEAILRNTFSPLPANEAIEWYHRVISTGSHNIGVPGTLTHTGTRIEFRPDMKLKPVKSFPHNIKDDLTGCVVQYYEPIRRHGKVPNNLYIIAHDPYAFDQSTDSESLGAAYVYMQPNNIAPPGDRLVATYFGRPRTTDDYNHILFLLAEYYNAKIGFENDRGDVIGYAKRFKKLDLLADEFELAFDADIPKSKSRRQFGMHIGSGKENLRMHKGNTYLRDWLITPRGKDENGNSILNLHTIHCPSTLQEISKYRLEGGNFDRISALRILAYYQKELVYKEQHVEIQVPYLTGSGFFDRKHFR